MKANKRGLSDVVTTVLIILVVVAAIAVVGSIVLRSVNQAGDTLEKSQVCLSNKVEITSCQYTVGGNAYISFRRIGDGSISTNVLLSGAKPDLSLTLLQDNGAVPVGDFIAFPSGNPLAEGGSDYAQVTLDGGRSARTVEGSVIFTLKDNSKQTCAVQKVNCELSA